jgi:type IX secretion system PorP/SprF family membrane protein
MNKLYIKMALALGLLPVLLPEAAHAQDPQFTQFYAAPLYHNPAFAGAAHRGRAIANYRNQWPSIPGAFVTYAASIDNYYKQYNSGVGLIVDVDKSGSGNLMSYHVGGQYAYELQLNRIWAMRAGFEFGYRQRSLDFYRLLWRDQLTTQPGVTLPTTQDPSRNASQRNGFMDVSAGGLIYSKIFYGGLSFMHMNQPNQTLISETSRLPMRITLQGGANIPISATRSGRFNNQEVKTSISPAIIYRRQGEAQQIDLGAYVNVAPIVFGAWYRGIPLLRNAGGNSSQDAFALLIGLKMPHYSFGYSYDLTISGLGPGTAGSHELSLCYEFDTNKPGRRRHTAIPCPKF